MPLGPKPSGVKTLIAKDRNAGLIGTDNPSDEFTDLCVMKIHNYGQKPMCTKNGNQEVHNHEQRTRNHNHGDHGRETPLYREWQQTENLKDPLVEWQRTNEMRKQLAEWQRAFMGKDSDGESQEANMTTDPGTRWEEETDERKGSLRAEDCARKEQRRTIPENPTGHRMPNDLDPNFETTGTKRRTKAAQIGGDEIGTEPHKHSINTMMPTYFIKPVKAAGATGAVTKRKGFYVGQLSVPNRPGAMVASAELKSAEKRQVKKETSMNRTMHGTAAAQALHCSPSLTLFFPTLELEHSKITGEIIAFFSGC
jgi:hypothetical protein